MSKPLAWCWGYFDRKEEVNSNLNRVFVGYCKRRYAWDAINTMHALTWWKAWFSDSLICKVVEMLHNVPISAAPTERNWSLRGGIHTKLRNRMKVDTASQVVFIKHNLQLEYGDLFKKVRQSEVDEEVESEEENQEQNLSNEFELLLNDIGE